MSYKRSRQTFESDLQSQVSPYAFYGTPLPPLSDDVRDDGSFVPVWKQEVTDERGRKRLHGAFTGGFSAGYFNTVGSKEGWTPSTFVSSRASRAKDEKRSAADFMDEEDLADAEEKRQVETNEGFAGLGSTEDDHRRLGGLMDVFRPTGETAGVRLLKRMGWREGQGIGPKVRRKMRTDDAGDDAGEETHLFAPDNAPMISFSKKNDTRGLGQEGEEKLGATAAPTSSGRGTPRNDEEEDDAGLSLSSSNDKKKAKSKETKRTGFGVGILNDTGSDDEDPYSIGPKVSYNRILGGDKKPKKPPKPSIGSSNPLLSTKPVFISKKAKSSLNNPGFRRCYDGRLPIDGFVLSTDPNPLSGQEKSYPPPKVPPDWKSSKNSSSADTDNTSATYTSPAEAARASTLDAKSRASLLGETVLPGKSVFDYLKPSTRDRIATASGKTNLPAGLGEQAPTGYASTPQQQAKDLRSLIPELDPEVAAKALGRGVGGWMPYAEDEGKRDRYRSFLEYRAGIRDITPSRPPAMQKDEWLNELREFAQAAQVFKPMTGMMASRFTSSSSTPRTSQTSVSGGTTADRQDEPSPEDSAEVAARMGMYGPLTRRVTQFYPSRLLCKRFNVKPPEHVLSGTAQATSSTPPSSGATAAAATTGSGGDRFASAGFQTQHAESGTKTQELLSRETMEKMVKGVGGSSSAQTPNGGLGLPRRKEEVVVVDAERNEALESERPGEAVFRAIFGDSSDEE